MTSTSARFLTLTLAGLLLPTLAAAQQVEITPLLGFGVLDIAEENHSFDRTRGPGYQRGHGEDNFLHGVDIDEEPSFGLLVGLSVSRHTQIEFLYSRQDTTFDDRRFELFDRDMDIEYLHVGAVYEWTFERVRPFVGGSIGSTRISVPGGSENAFSVSPTGGLKVLLNDRTALRFTGRLFLTPIEENGPLGCPTGECQGRGGEEALADLQFSVGLTFRLGRPRG